MGSQALISPDQVLVANLKQYLATTTESDIPYLVDLNLQARLVHEYAKKQKQHGIQNDAAIAHIWTSRRLGELFTERESHPGGRPRKNPLDNQRSFPATLSELGATEFQSHYWQKQATLPKKEVEGYIESAVADPEGEPTTAGIYKLAQKRLRKPRTVDYPVPEGKYRCIVIDPPWPIQKILRQKRPMQDELDYPVKTIEGIIELPIPDLVVEEGCHIYLWTTHKFLPTAFDIFKEWDVRYQCLLTWVKPTGMTPFSWMYNTEHILFGRIGNLALAQLGLKLSFSARVTGHSEKPDVFYERVRQVSPGPRLAMFERKARDGFVVWGDEIHEGLARRQEVG